MDVNQFSATGVTGVSIYSLKLKFAGHNHNHNHNHECCSAVSTAVRPIVH